MDVCVSSNFSIFSPRVPISQQIACRFVPYFAMNMELKSLAGRVTSNPTYVLNLEEKKLIKKAFIQCQTLFSKECSKNLKQIPATELKKIFFELLDEGHEKDHITTLHTFLKLFDTDELIKYAHLNQETLDLQMEKDVLIKEKALKSILKIKGKAFLKECLMEASYFGHHIMNVITTVLGLNELGGKPQNPYAIEMSSYEAKAKLESYIAILAYPSLIFMAFCTALGSPATAAIATAIMLAASITGLIIYTRYLRPCPKDYFGFTNLNFKALRSLDPPTFKRKNVLDRIQNAFESGKGAIIVADPGTGKTMVVQSLTEMIVDQECRPFLKNSQIFAANANQITGMAYGGIILPQVNSAFRGHENEAIFYFDEIHSAFQPKTTEGRPADSLLTFQNDFKRILSSTTTKQFEQYVEKDEAFLRRNVVIRLDHLTQEELQDMMAGNLEYLAPELGLEDHIMDYIIQNASKFNSKTSQVDGTSSLLSAAIVRATNLSCADTEREISHLKAEIEHLENTLFHSEQTPSKNMLHQFQEKKRLLNEREAFLTQKQNELKRIKCIEKVALALKHKGYLFAEKQDKKKWLLNYTMNKFLTEYAESAREKLGIPSRINKRLIDTLVAEVNKTN